MLIVFYCGLGHAQPSGTPPDLSIEGRVVSGTTGDSISRAQVTIQNAEGVGISSTNSSRSGLFVLKNIKPGKYLLCATHAGFLKGSCIAGSADESARTVQVLAGQAAKGVVLKLMPFSVITGRVLTEGGEPVANATAVVSGPAAMQGGIAAGHRVYTNDLGEYRIYGLSPGKYVVSASSRNGKKTYAATYYPNALSAGEAVPLELAAGKLLDGIDIVLSRRRSSYSLPSNGLELPEAATIAGQVVNADTGAPIARAAVVLENSAGGKPDDSETAIADAAGFFRLQNVRPGTYRLSAGRNGFLYVAHGAHGSEELSVGAGQVLKDSRVELVAQGVIAGRVVNDDHEPLANTVVIAITSSLHGNVRQFDLAKRVYTNDLGEYRLYGLLPGNYSVYAIHRGAEERRTGATDATTGETYSGIYYPNALIPGEATLLKVTPGRTVSGIDLILPKSGKTRLRGRVSLPGNQFSGRLTVSLIPREASGIARFTPRRTAQARAGTGEFEIQRVPPGEYVLMADWPGEGKKYAGRLPVNVGETNIEGLLLPLIPAVQVSGWVTSPDDLDKSGLGVSLHAIGDQEIAGGGRGKVQQDGSFTIVDVRPEHYFLEVSGLKDDSYLKAVTMGTRTVNPSDVELDAGAGALELVVSSSGGEIEGTVFDDRLQPSSGASVALFPEPRTLERNRLYRRITTDRDGRYVLRGIAPGNYKLFASNSIYLDAYRDPNAEMPFASQGAEVTIKENGREKLTLKLISGTFPGLP